MEAIGTVNLAADKTFSGMKKEETDPEEEIEEKEEELEAEETEVMGAPVLYASFISKY